MPRLPLALALSLLALPLAACGESPAQAPADQAATPVEPQEVVMEEAMITLPESELAMLEEEIQFLRKETARMQEELDVSKSAPSPDLMARQVSARGELVRAQNELRRLKQELEQTKVRLAQAEARGDQLEEDLTETRQVLVQTTERLGETERTLKSTRDDLEGALRVAADAGWSDLVSQSQVALCPKGRRKKMEACRAQARQAVAPLEPAARACLRAGHAAPQLHPAERGEDMPRQAVWIGDTDRDWYVVLCDPDLPEAQALLADLDDRGRPSSSTARDDLDDLDDLLDEPEPRVAKRPTERDDGVRRTSREQPAPRVTRTREPAPEPLEPPELRGSSDSDIDLASLGIQDLDAGSDDDDKKSRAERRREKKEAEALEEARRRRGILEGAGEDLVDE